jgi:hypothetical protein
MREKQVSIAERVWKLANPMWEAVSIYPEDSDIIFLLNIYNEQIISIFVELYQNMDILALALKY